MKRSAKWFVQVFSLFVLVLFLVGCATGKIANVSGWTASIYQSASSTKIGCLPEEITITDLDQHGGISRARDWFATCKGKTYFCSGVNDGYGGTTNVSCMKKSPNKAHKKSKQ